MPNFILHFNSELKIKCMLKAVRWTFHSGVWSERTVSHLSCSNTFWYPSQHLLEETCVNAIAPFTVLRKKKIKVWVIRSYFTHNHSALACKRIHKHYFINWLPYIKSDLLNSPFMYLNTIWGLSNNFVKRFIFNSLDSWSLRMRTTATGLPNSQHYLQDLQKTTQRSALRRLK